jgi:hypothetical protein
MPPDDPEPTGDATEPTGDTITIPATSTNDATPPVTPKRTPRPPKTFTEEEVEAIRQEEKQKLYARLGRVDELEATVAELTKQETDRQKAAEKAQKDAERAAKKKEEEEMELRDLLERKDQEWTARLDQEKIEREKILAILDQERKHASLQQYLSQKMMDEAEYIMPELHYTVGGNTPEEIDQSVERAKQTTAAIVQNINARMQGNNASRPAPGVTAPPVGPSEMVPTNRTLTADDLKQMTPEEYAQNREALLREAGRSYRAR